MRREIVWLLIGAAAYYGFLRYKGIVTGNPIKPMVVGA